MHWLPPPGTSQIHQLPSRVSSARLRPSRSQSLASALPAILKPPVKNPTASQAYSIDKNIIRWHNRFGHLGTQNVKKLPSMCEGINFTEKHHPNNCICEPCLTMKGKRRPHNHPIEPGKHKMDLIYLDVVGPMPVKGYDGSRYLVTFSCDHSKMARVYLIKTKGEVYDCFIHFKKHNERPDLGWVIKRLRDDNGGEYISGKLQKKLFEEGIDWEPTEPYSSQMNGPAERLGQTLYRKAAPILKHAGLDLKYWPEAVRHAGYLYMRSPHSKIKKTPFEAWHGRRPHIGHIRTFGSIIYYSNPGKPKKFVRDETNKGILVGYEGDTLCRILKPNGRICRAAAIQTVERMLWEQFDPEDPVEIDPNIDHFSDPTKPGVPARTFDHIKPMPISIALPKPDLKKRPAAEDWFIEPVTRIPSYGSIPRSVLSEACPLAPPALANPLQVAPLTMPSGGCGVNLVLPHEIRSIRH
jgi:hypothetical protein